jgi:hypothetical protein
MRSAALALASVCVLAACNPSAPGGGGFPDLTSGSYRAEANIMADDGTTMPVVMIRDGRKLRMEMTIPGAGQTVMITNPDTGEDFVISDVGGRQMAMRLSGQDTPVRDPAADWSGEMAANATRTGNCNVAGENGVEWTRAATEGDAASTSCVTSDGIILRGTDGDRVVWETTSVQRGPQSAELFALPAGVQVMDLGAMMAPASPTAPGGGGDLCTTLRNAGAPADALAQAGC